LVDALDALQIAYRKSDGREPALAVIRALCQSWTECALTYLHAPSCEDPATGLATTSHLRARLSELYRAAQLQGWSMPETHALLVAEPITDQASPAVGRDAELTQLAGHLRTVFKEAAVVARLGPTRVATIAGLDAQLPEQLQTLRSLVSYWDTADGAADHDIGPPRSKVWIEPLPTMAEWSDSFVNDLANPLRTQ
jgi:hypothetical protein